MRYIRTFLVHLYIDTETPRRVCGKLQALPDRKSYLFKSETALVDALIQLAQEPAQLPRSNEEPEKEENDFPDPLIQAD
jgi:hypothetical protein